MNLRSPILLFALFLLLAGLPACGLADAPATAPAALTQVTSFGTNPGNLLLYTHVPAGLPPGSPLVVVLHGCTQSAADIEATGWSAAADAYRFAVAYPQQQASNNRSGCFNWFLPGDTTRGQGEALSIRQMVAHLQGTLAVDSQRIFVVGFSAGGFMAAAMLATYPDVFAAGAINAGGPYGCATNLAEATACMSPGVTKSPAAWGELVRSAYPSFTGPRPRVTLWHGSADPVVAVANLDASVWQWTYALQLDGAAGTGSSEARFAHRTFGPAGGPVLVESYELYGLGHAVAVDPALPFEGSGLACGSVGLYAASAPGLCATELQARFFGLAPEQGPGPLSGAPRVAAPRTPAPR
ncbi:PHB depolymerase family esterase [Aggregicoccus sp. 17bor-14]|uniref:extracellular catalytic domain type 1 short-chain-length polyhydroxyalkanoate depolymerase n=1 Tax=Myxococcaceae TaxID=31 RepID=UPI00129D00F5|nr:MULTISPECIES: PHB depolymerase family esterase [Myxococcaceae]MBF5043568.1 PHB depolymerase family esterase [Simulacricoccus sp. 17bor-14]MRI89327.1 PHB depolymerase family esterase [Aggregicoccus sp. 17bor-14]